MNSNIKLIVQSWWDEGDPESLTYLIITDNKKRVWMSTWWDVRDWSDIKEQIREETTIACEKYRISVDVSSDDVYDWEESQNVRI